MALRNFNLDLNRREIFFKKKSCALFTFCKYETKNTKNVKKRRKKKGYDFKVQSCNNIHYFCDYETYTSLYLVVFSCSLNFSFLFYFMASFV